VKDWEGNFQKLEQKLSRAVELFQQTQADKLRMREELGKLRAEYKERARRLETLERESQTLRREREEVRGRIEKLLEQIDRLTKGDSSA
jgi:FtsZ-binding cell division protein ZapB